jgi:bacteriocin biosynthesis cyclodehydratase domain-containing protein
MDETENKLIKDKFDIFFDENNQAYQIRTKNDVIVVEFSDTDKETIFNKVMKLYEKHPFLTFDYIKTHLLKEHSYEKILDVVQELQECGVLNERNLQHEDNKCSPSGYASFVDTNNSFANISEAILGYIGEKELGEKIKEKATVYGYSHFQMLDFHKNATEQSIKTLFEGSSFVIVDISEWNPYYIDMINVIALEFSCPWLLIEGITDNIHYSIGPLFHGKETGCYECFKSRLRSNDEFVSYTQSYESYLKTDKKTSKPDSVPALIKDIAASIIVMDISKFIGGWYIPESWRSCLVFNTLSFATTKHSFLKAPICSVCNPSIDYNPYPWLESVTAK